MKRAATKTMKPVRAASYCKRWQPMPGDFKPIIEREIREVAKGRKKGK